MMRLYLNLLDRASVIIAAQVFYSKNSITMKKIFLSLLSLAGFVITIDAQKNSVLLYGTINAQHKNEPDNSELRQFGFSPGLGYQFSEHWTAGISGSYDHEKLK